jgi:TorA maturation chaperone TorD
MPDATPVVVEPAPATRRSIFGNYQPEAAPEPPLSPASPLTASSADSALARAFIHQFLARAFDYPAAATWAWLCQVTVRDTMSAARQSLAEDGDGESPLKHLLDALRPDGFEAFHDDYIAAIGHAARGSCPPNEIEYGDLKADPLFQPHRLADLAAFYRAFGLELGPEAGERHDHVSAELEFMGVLAAQEAQLRPQAGAGEALAVCLDAQRKFLREHLGRWTPAFTRRLHRAVGDGALGRLALFTLAFIEAECGRAGVQPGSTDLLLRPADDGAALCEGCGLKELPPGAATAAPAA